MFTLGWMKHLLGERQDIKKTCSCGECRVEMAKFFKKYWDLKELVQEWGVRQGGESTTFSPVQSLEEQSICLLGVSVFEEQLFWPI